MQRLARPWAVGGSHIFRDVLCYVVCSPRLKGGSEPRKLYNTFGQHEAQHKLGLIWLRKCLRNKRNADEAELRLQLRG